MPHPVDVDGGAEVEVGLDGGGDLGEKRHPVFLVSAENSFFTFPSRVEEGRRRMIIWMKNPLRSHNLTISSGALLSQNLSPGRRRSNVRNGI